MPAKVNLRVLLAFLATAAATGSEFSQQKSLCPKPSAGDRLRTVSSASVQHCAISCWRSARCDRFSLAQETGTCYLGDEDVDYDQLWTPAGNCQTYVKTPDFKKLKMKLMYNFKVGGMLNLADPGVNTLTALDVSVGNQGAEFKGNQGSYLKAQTPGFDQLLNYGTEFSTFVQVQHVMSSSVVPSYYTFQQCSGDMAGNMFAKFSNNRLAAFNTFVSGPYMMHAAISPPMTLDDGQLHWTSNGFVFNKTLVTGLYYNGSIVNADASVNLEGPLSTSDLFNCLFFGCLSQRDSCLNGSMTCFGVSSKALSQGEFKRLEGYCVA